MVETLHYAGEYIVEAIDILQPGGLSINIQQSVQQVTLYEDLFSPFMSGNIICYDSNDLPSYLKNAGVDLLRLKIRTPTMEPRYAIEQYFHIYKLADRYNVSDRSQSYIFYFTSAESIEDVRRPISKTFRGTGETLIKSFVKDYWKSDKKFNYTKSDNDITYTSNFWNASKNVAYIVDHSLTAQEPDRVFFENRSGFNFLSLVDLSKATPLLSFAGSDHVNTTVNFSLQKDFFQDYLQIQSYKVYADYDYLKDRENGGLNTRMFSYDVITKSFIDTTFSPNDVKRDLMNPNRFYKRDVINNSFYDDNGSTHIAVTKLNGVYNNTKDISDAGYKQRRINLLRSFKHKIEITVFGRLDYTVGMTVNIDMNRLKQIDKHMTSKEIQDPTLSGVYLISAINHQFSRDGKHLCTFELIRDSIKE